MKRAFCAAVLGSLLVCTSARLEAQGSGGRSLSDQGANSNAENHLTARDSRAEEELQKGTALTRHREFSEAIPHLLAARGRVANEYAASFNLALCYVGSGEFQKAIPILNNLRDHGHDNADVENLLAQAYVGTGQSANAMASLEKAASITPGHEKLYLFVADACMDRSDYALGLKVVDLGLKNLPKSAWLHYERAVFLSYSDQFDLGKVDFELAQKLGSGNEIGYSAAAHEAYLQGDMAGAIRAAREGVARSESPLLLEILGQALVADGAAPGQSEFEEALAALVKVVAARPNDASAQVGLSKLYLMSNRLDEAIAHLEMARKLAPNKPSVYASLAKAYQRRGDTSHAQEMLSVLSNLNEAKAGKIRLAPEDHKAGYVVSAVEP
jgi:tetratricopeptide (TPR) repeat protein